MFEFSQVIPLYISPNDSVGTEESELFFPFDSYENDEHGADVEGGDVAEVDSEMNVNFEQS